MKSGVNNLKPILRRAAERLWRRKLLLLLILLMTLTYSSLSILRHRHFASSAFDLGIFDQTIWHYSRLEAPYTSFRSNRKDENILGDHFHPILALLAPVYWFTDSVEALLAAQALLFSIAAVPVFLFTEKRLGKLAAYLFTASYLIFWGIQLAVDFDFHEIAFAVPLIASAIYFIDERRFKLYLTCAVLLLLTKEDLSLVVAFFGLYLLVLKEFRLGVLSLALGTTWFFLTLKVFLPFFSGGQGYRYWDYRTFGADPLSSLRTILKDPLLLFRTFFSPAVKLRTLWYIFYPFLFLACASPLIIIAVPLLLERFLSNTQHYWTQNYHYTATISPVIVMASADGLKRLAGLTARENLRRPAVLSASIIILFLNLALLPSFPLWKLTERAYWHRTESERTGYRALALVPPDASVTAQAAIVPHLAHRRNLFLITRPFFIPDSDYIVASSGISSYPFESYREIEDYLAAQREDYSKIFERDGWIILKRNTGAQKQGLNIPVKTEADSNEIISAVYTRILGREADSAGLEFWNRYVAEYKPTTRSIVREFALSDEFRLALEAQASKETAVKLVYSRLLAREPTPEESRKSAGESFRELILNLLGSAEYESRFDECLVPGEPPVADRRCLQSRR